jgi:hypothetical protein
MIDLAKKLKDELQLLRNNKQELSQNPDSIKALKHIVEMITYQAWYFRMPKELLFSIRDSSEEIIKDLDRKLIPKALKDEFSTHGHALSSSAMVDGIYGNWEIIDNSRVYIVEEKNSKLSIYYSKFYSEMERFCNRHASDIRSSEAKKELTELVYKFVPKIIKDKAKKRVKRLLKYQTIKDFTEKLYEMAKIGKSNVLGEKGRDNYLRDFGYWDRIPMDRHEMRFIIRTGIYHVCSSENKNDPLDKKSLHDALINFCSKYLKGKVVEDIDLGDAPGIVDIFIWYYCGRERYNICGSTPKCKKCGFNGVCLYATITNAL